ncbi:hypothetical protein ACFVVA_14935 [Kitasatospora sp. NPDC058048]|uniref:hypothetical protein n=1 Tax=Kitasatospora sp. NPDC058048 TaxID=3346313 RepID=UPI0036DC040E
MTTAHGAPSDHDHAVPRARRPRREPVTDETVARLRVQARTDPASGLPALAEALRGRAYGRPRPRPEEAVPFLEESAGIYRALVADGGTEHLGAAANALASLALKYSLAHADGPALAARQEAADLARRAEADRPVEGLGRAAVLHADLAHGLAEAGRFDEAVDAARAVADRSRAVTEAGGSDLTWRLLDLTVLLRLADRTEEAVAVEHEALAWLREGRTEPARSPVPALRAAGAALWFADLGRTEQSHRLLADAARSCERLPARGDAGNFGFNDGLRSALFARSGVRDEQAAADAPDPLALGVDPGRRLQPVLGLNLHHWSFSLRASFEDGLVTLARAVEAITDTPEPTDRLPDAEDPSERAYGPLPLPEDRDLLATLGTLTRRLDLRRAVRGDHPSYYAHLTLPRLRRSVRIERRLHTTGPAHDTRRLARALTDLAMAQLVHGDHTEATGTLHEAHALAVRTENPAG